MRPANFLTKIGRAAQNTINIRECRFKLYLQPSKFSKLNIFVALSTKQKKTKKINKIKNHPHGAHERTLIKIYVVFHSKYAVGPIWCVRILRLAPVLKVDRTAEDIKRYQNQCVSCTSSYAYGSFHFTIRSTLSLWVQKCVCVYLYCMV